MRLSRVPNVAVNTGGCAAGPIASSAGADRRRSRALPRRRSLVAGWDDVDRLPPLRRDLHACRDAGPLAHLLDEVSRVAELIPRAARKRAQLVAGD